MTERDVVVPPLASYAQLRHMGMEHNTAVTVLRFRRFLQVLRDAPVRDGARVIPERWLRYAHAEKVEWAREQGLVVE